MSLANKEGLAEARREGVRTIPTVLLTSDGAELERWVGKPPPGALVEALGELGIDGRQTTPRGA